MDAFVESLQSFNLGTKIRSDLQLLTLNPFSASLDNLQEEAGLLQRVTDWAYPPEPKDDSEIKASEWGGLSDLDEVVTPQVPAGLDPDAYLSMAQIVQKYGFKYSAHQVTTADGYELTVMRITSPEMQKGASAVFLQHGLFSSAETWVMNAENAVAFTLARAGFDVWLGNNRGSRYSRKNNHIDPDRDPAEFFNFSFFELGEFDAPAQIDFVRKETGQSKIAYVGHSQGTSQMFAALAYNFGDLQNKLTVFAALAPVANLKNSPDDMLTAASKYWRQLEATARTG